VQATVVIPARLASTRFPEKVLAAATGRPLVQHVVDRVRQCRRVADVVVAADHPRIADALRPFGTRVEPTRPDHPTGTDRIAEVARRLPAGVDLLVNVQGDEPEIEPEAIDRLIERMAETGESMGTLATPMRSMADVADPNRVKVVLSASGRAIYFSRSPVPFDRDGQAAGPGAWLLHLGVYAYRRAFLLDYAAWPPTPLEKLERLEQLRAIEHDVPIGVVVVERAAGGVDTAEQYAAFVARFAAGSG